MEQGLEVLIMILSFFAVVLVVTIVEVAVFG